MIKDTYWDNTVLAMHMDGPNAGAAFVDLKGHTVTAISGAKFSTAQSKFGGSSALLNGTTDYLSILDSEDFELTPTHTIEMWVRFTALPVASANCVLVSKWNGAANKRSWLVALYNTAGVYTLRAYYSSDGTTVATYQFTVTPVINTWYSYAITNDGIYVRAFVNGVQPSAGQSYTSGSLFNSDEPVGVGTQNITSTPAGFLAGYIDDLRITKGVARYTADYTAATAAFDDGLPPYANLTAPMPTLGFYGGASFMLSAPLSYVTVGVGATTAVTAPAPTLSFTAHSSYGENAVIAIAPTPTLSAYLGGNATLTATTPTLSSAATGTAFASAALTAPAPTLSSTVTGSYTASARLAAPTPNLVGYGGAVCSVTTPAGTLAATGTGGGVARAAVTATVPLLSASATAQNHGSALLVAPAGKMATGLQAYLFAPAATLTAIGTATITATYEAYALNLNHADPTAHDELTRYTNFPFTHVVRYKNSYFGVSSGALYLLEGTTDNTVPIPYDVKTAITDFDAPELKTVRYAYFGGRMGAASTVSITAGEATPVSYSYTTPRGPLAQNYRQPFGRGIKARYFSFGVSGSDVLEIDSIDLDVLTLKRRI